MKTAYLHSREISDRPNGIVECKVDLITRRCFRAIHVHSLLLQVAGARENVVRFGTGELTNCGAERREDKTDKGENDEAFLHLGVVWKLDLETNGCVFVSQLVCLLPIALVTFVSHGNRRTCC